jgi:mRNA interferase MazF
MTPAAPYAPARGDVIWIDFSPQAGREQAGRRPALVLSTFDYNLRVGLALVCPVTSRVKGYLSEVPLPDGMPVSGVVLADQVKSVDWRARRAHFICAVPAQTFRQVRFRILAMLR